MSELRFGVLGLLACLLALAGGAAHAAPRKQAVFRVTLSATLTKTWTYTHSEEAENCVRTTRGSGTTITKLSVRRPARIRAIAAGATRIRFSGAISTIAGSIVRSGSKTVVTRGDPPCERRTVSDGRCTGQREVFSGGATSLRNPRKRILQPAPTRGVRAARPPRCPAEPADIQAIRTDLPLATGPLDRADVFARDVPRFFVSGDTTQETALSGDLQGRVVERVHWTVLFTRLKG